MKNFDFTDKAERDLEIIIEFTLDQWGKTKANQYINGLEELAQMLAENPDIGINRDVLSTGLLSFPYQSHILFYLKKQSGVTIVRVLHANMDVEKQME